ncbi:MAG: TSUP family transporter [bacterium]|nr:TSUP family transporter [bacterium]
MVRRGEGGRMWQVGLLCVSAFVAGCVDAVAGGGGLIQLPVLFIVLPEAPVVTLLAVNKCAAASGTLVATVRYAGAVEVAWGAALTAAGVAAVASFLGARTVSVIDPAVLRPVMAVLLVATAFYTYLHKEYGVYHRPRLRPTGRIIVGSLAGFVIGFYDGFFGPGTGTYLMLLFVILFGFDFLHAAAATKVVNLTTNVAALAFFVGQGQVAWEWALPMAAANVAGGLVGAQVAVLRGSGFIRRAGLVMAIAVIVRFVYDIVSSWVR